MNRRRGIIAVALILAALTAFLLFTGQDAPFAPRPDRPDDDGSTAASPGLAPDERRRSADREAEDLLAGPNPFAAGETGESGDLLVEVRREDGARVLGATVLIAGAKRKTDEEGYALFEGIEPAAKYEIHAYGPEFYDSPGVAKIGVTAGCRSEIRIVIKRGGAVRGTLVTPDGKPLGVEAIVGTHRDSLNRFTTAASVGSLRWSRCGPGGRFEIRGIPTGTQFVKATANFHTAGSSRPIEGLPGVTQEGVRIVLRPAGRIRGRVVARGTNRPMVGISVVCIGPRAGTVVRTDREGRFVHAGLEPGRYELRVSGAQDCAVAHRGGFEVVAGREVADVRIEMGPGGTIVGTVIGAPVQSSVRLFFRSTGVDVSDRAHDSGWLNADGEFRCDGLEPGTWQILLVGTSNRILARDEVVVVEGRETRTDLRAATEGGDQAVTGRVFDTGGRPVAGASVQLLDHNGQGGAGLVRTDEAGTFAFYGVRPGVWRVLAMGTGGSGWSAEFTVDEEGSHSGVRITLRRSLRARFLVRHGSGNGARHVWLTLLSEDGYRRLLYAGTDGSTQAQLTPGTWAVHIGRHIGRDALGDPVATIEVKPEGSRTFEIVID